MKKGKKIVVLVSVAIVTITAMIVALLSPGAYEEQCKIKAREILSRIYAIEGGKDKFNQSYDKGVLTSEGKEELQNLKKVLSQCPGLKSTPQGQLDIDLHI
jgi:hypothetical protein